MELEKIYTPIDQNIKKMEAELNLFINSCIPSINELFNYFFRKSGKHLRPALTFLTAGAVNNIQTNNNNLIQLALSLELLHSASLIHDDIIDKDFMRREQRTLNNSFGNKLAVLAGDTLFAKSYAIVAKFFTIEYSQTIADLSIKMCVAEIEQAKGNINREKYFNIIEGKTALFTSTCCKLGAMVAGATEDQIKNYRNFGLNFGMAYQIMDDYMDKDPNALNNVSLEEANKFAKKAKKSIANLKDTVYKQKLYDLMEYVMANK